MGTDGFDGHRMLRESRGVVETTLGWCGSCGHRRGDSHGASLPGSSGTGAGDVLGVQLRRARRSARARPARQPRTDGAHPDRVSGCG